jgi:hypothetical protein
MDSLVVFDGFFLAGFDFGDEIHAGLAIQGPSSVDAARWFENLTRFLILTGLLGDSSNGCAFPGQKLSKLDDFGASCTLRMGPVRGTFSLSDSARNLVQ